MASSKLHFEDLEIVHPPQAAAAQREIPQRGFLEIEFGKIFAHGPQ